MVVIKCNFIKFHLHEFFLPCYGQNYLSYRLFLYWLLKMLRILFSRLDFLIANTLRTILCQFLQIQRNTKVNQLVKHRLLWLDQRPSVDLSEDYLYCFHSLSKWHKKLCWFSAGGGKKPALMFALGHMKDIGMFYSALPRSIIPWLGGIQDEDKKWAEPRFLRTTLHVLGP